MFDFHDPGPLSDRELTLELVRTIPAVPERVRVPSYEFSMRARGAVGAVGDLSLRIGDTEALTQYGGHIGYGVGAEHRGHRYAARSVRLVMPLARLHGAKLLWITCNPENEASRRSCELAGATFVEIVELPPESEMYARGERRKCRYRLEL